MLLWLLVGLTALVLEVVLHWVHGGCAHWHTVVVGRTVATVVCTVVVCDCTVTVLLAGTVTDVRAVVVVRTVVGVHDDEEVLTGASVIVLVEYVDVRVTVCVCVDEDWTHVGQTALLLLLVGAIVAVLVEYVAVLITVCVCVDEDCEHAAQAVDVIVTTVG